MLSFLKNLSPTELILIGLIIVVLFGTKIAISLGKTGGQTLKEIKKIKKNFTESLEN